MSAISNPASSTNIATLLASTPSTPDAAGTAAAPPTTDADGADRGPATNVQLSDKVKAILAKASTDAAVAARLQSFVQDHRTPGAATASSSSDSSSSTTQATNVNQAFAQLTDSSAQQADTESSGPLTAAHDFSNGVKFDGFTVGVMASAETGSYRIEMMGPNGLSYFDFRFGTSDEASGGSNLPPGTSVSDSQQGNVEYINVTQNVAAATSTTASTGAESASSSAALAQTDQITFAIDFSTGSIQATETSSLTAASAQSSKSGSQVSTVA
jgi:hypothetical protein